MNKRRTIVFSISLFLALLGFNLKAQIPTKVFEITQILVDACDNVEGANEMFMFQIGPNPVNISSLRVDGAGSNNTIVTAKWPNTSNSWLGVATPPAKPTQVAQINATIANCGKLIEPVGGILPAGRKVILITSTDFNPTANSFAALTDTVYIIFQNDGNTAGHFANYSSGASNRTLRLTHTTSGVYDEVVYDKSLLTDATGMHVAADGAGVRYTFSGIATYYNNGCQAPFQPLSAAWTCPATICESAPAINLNSLITGMTGGNWGGQGVSNGFFNPSGLSGYINITYTVSSGANCFVTENHLIQVINSADASWNAPATICQSATPLSLSGLVTGTPGGTFTGNGVSSNIFNPASQNGPVIITYIVGSGVCSDTLKDTINVVQQANAAWTNPDTICKNELPLDLNTLITGDQGGAWYGQGIVNQHFLDFISNQYSYNLDYVVGNASCSDTLSQTIYIDKVKANFLVAPITGPSPLTVTLTDNSTDASYIEWISSNGLTSNTSPEHFTFSEEGNYTITLVATSDNNCKDSISKTITVENRLTVAIPNVFTPDGDNLNDIFRSVISTEVDSYNMLIFNRWGENIAKCDINGWDGKVKNSKAAPDGVYFYVVTFSKNGKDYNFKGSVTLLH